MSTTPFRAYLESRVVSASPLQLIHLAYEGAIDAIADAREHLAQKRIHERSKAITKAQLIVAELQNSLDHRQGGAVSQQLGRLYDYIQGLLRDGNFRQTDAPLAEAQRLLQTLGDAWKQLSANEQPAVQSTDAYGSSPWMSSEEPVLAGGTSFQL